MNIYSFIWNNLNDINSIIVISMLIVFLILLIANYYDLKYGIIPNKLSFFLFSYGIIVNLLIFNALNDNFFMYCYLAYMSIIFMISFALWKIAFWGGGDLKLFCAIGSSLSFIDILNQFNSFSVLNNFAFNSQVIVYPKIFSILINSLILSFPFIILLVFFRLFREKKLNLLYLVFSDIHFLIKEISTKTVFIANLKEGMVLENYYFKSNDLYELIKKVLNINKNSEKYNLKIDKYKKCSYYFKSSSMLGLTDHDIKLINFAYKESLINFPNFKIKMGIPFLPALTAAYLVFLAFGDLTYIFLNIF